MEAQICTFCQFPVFLNEESPKLWPVAITQGLPYRFRQEVWLYLPWYSKYRHSNFVQSFQKWNHENRTLQLLLKDYKTGFKKNFSVSRMEAQIYTFCQFPVFLNEESPKLWSVTITQGLPYRFRLEVWLYLPWYSRYRHSNFFQSFKKWNHENRALQLLLRDYKTGVNFFFFCITYGSVDINIQPISSFSK